MWFPARDDETLVRVGLDDLTVTPIAVGPNADTPILAADHLWVPVRDAQAMVVIDPSTTTVVQRIELNGRPLTPLMLDGALWFVTRDDDMLHRVDLATFDPVVPVATQQIRVGRDPDRAVEAAGRLWVPARRGNVVTVVDPTDLTIVASIPVGARPDTPVVTPGLVWVPNLDGTTVTVIDAETLDVVADVEVGSEPRTGVASDDFVWIPVLSNDFMAQLSIADLGFVGGFGVGLSPDTPSLIDGVLWVPAKGSDTITEITLR